MITIATVVNVFRGLFIYAHDSITALIARLASTDITDNEPFDITDQISKSITTTATTHIEDSHRSSISDVYEAQITNQYQSTILNKNVSQIESKKCVDIADDYSVLVTNMKTMQVTQIFIGSLLNLLEQEITILIGGINVISEWIVHYPNNATIRLFTSIGNAIRNYVSIPDATPYLKVICEDKTHG